jgi:hypothetical protein
LKKLNGNNVYKDLYTTVKNMYENNIDGSPINLMHLQSGLLINRRVLMLIFILTTMNSIFDLFSWFYCRIHCAMMMSLMAIEQHWTCLLLLLVLLPYSHEIAEID